MHALEHFCMLGLDFFLCVYLSFICVFFSCKHRSFCLCIVCFCCVGFSFFHTKPRDLLWRTSPKWLILCWVGRRSLTQSVSQSVILWSCNDSKCLLCCQRFFDRPVVPLPPPPEAWQHPPVEPLPPQWGRGLPPEFPPRFLPPPEVPMVSDCFSADTIICIDDVCSAVYALTVADSLK